MVKSTFLMVKSPQITLFFVTKGDQTFNSAIVACEKGEGRPQF
jgi:hypothetical protein